MVAMPLIAVWSYLLDGVFIGATAIAEMRNSIFIGLAVYLPLWWLTQGLGNHGLWLAFTTFTAVRSAVLVTYYLRYRSTRWRDTA
jgi:MATE family multidrug resistance protein